MATKRRLKLAFKGLKFQKLHKCLLCVARTEVNNDIYKQKNLKKKMCGHNISMEEHFFESEGQNI